MAVGDQEQPVAALEKEAAGRRQQAVAVKGRDANAGQQQRIDGRGGWGDGVQASSGRWALRTASGWRSVA